MYSVRYKGVALWSEGANPKNGEAPIETAQEAAAEGLRERLKIKLTEAQDLRDAISALEKDLDPTPAYMKRSGG